MLTSFGIIRKWPESARFTLSTSPSDSGLWANGIAWKCLFCTSLPSFRVNPSYCQCRPFPVFSYSSYLPKKYNWTYKALFYSRAWLVVNCSNDGRLWSSWESMFPVHWLHSNVSTLIGVNRHVGRILHQERSWKCFSWYRLYAYEGRSIICQVLCTRSVFIEPDHIFQNITGDVVQSIMPYLHTGHIVCLGFFDLAMLTVSVLDVVGDTIRATCKLLLFFSLVNPTLHCDSCDIMIYSGLLEYFLLCLPIHSTAQNEINFQHQYIIYRAEDDTRSNC